MRGEVSATLLQWKASPCVGKAWTARSACSLLHVPREATQEDIAAEPGLAAVTVGEHLRKIEATVLTGIVPGAGTGG